MLIENVKNLPPFAEIRYPDGGAPIPVCPATRHRKGHMFHVIVGEKDTFQIIEDH